MKLPSLCLVAAICSTAWSFPAWYPENFSKPGSGDTALANHLHRVHLDIADSIHIAGSVEVDGIRLAANAWLPSGATGTVFLVHGYYDHSGIWSDHIRRLLDRGLAVVVVDLQGHGISDGRRMDIDSFGQYTKGLRALEDSMRSRAPLPWSLVGHSLGGAIALDRARTSDFPYAKVLLLAPMVRYKGWTWTGLALPFVSLAKDHLDRSRILSSTSDTNFLARIRTDPLEGWIISTNWLKQVRKWNASMEGSSLAKARWSVLQGNLDQTVDWRWGAPWLKAKIPGLEVNWLPLARHHIHNEGGSTGIAARRIFDDFLATPLPKQRK